MNKVLNYIFIFVTLFIIISLYIIFVIAAINDDNFYFIFFNFILFLYSLYRVFYSSPYNYSLYQVFYLFSLFFFCLAPLMQYVNNTATIFGYFIRDDTYMKINVILLLVFFVIDFMYFFIINKLNKKVYSTDEITLYLRDNIILKILIIFLISFSFLYILYVNAFNLKGLFLRGGDEIERYVVITSSIHSFLRYVIRPLPVFAFVFYYLFGKNINFKIFLFITAILTCFPISLPRFLIGAYYIPIVFVIFTKLRLKNVFSIVYMFILAILFPLLGLFRNIDKFIRYDLFDTACSVLSTVYLSQSYDSYQSFAFVFQEKFITFGRQLLGVFSIWIPRVLWENKPIGTGYTIAEKYGLGWDNIAMNFFGEGYSNFGILGVFLFAICIAIFMAYFDSWFWNKYKGNIKNINAIFYLIIFALETYILRGDLMSSTTALIGTLISCFIIKSVFSLFLMKSK